MVSLGNEIWYTPVRIVGEYEEECYDPGFYFSDEAQLFNGPFPTKEQAELALKQWVEAFLS